MVFQLQLSIKQEPALNLIFFPKYINKMLHLVFLLSNALSGEKIMVAN